MRVAIVTHQSADHLGGAEQSLLAIVDRWLSVDPELEPIVVGPSPARAMAEAVRARGLEWRDLPMTGWVVWDAAGGRPQRRIREAQNARATQDLVEFLNARAVGLVVTNTLVVPWGAIAAARLGIPHVWFVREFAEPAHGAIFPGGRENALRDIGALSTRVVANSSAVREALAPFVPDAVLAVGYPPVDLTAVRARAEAAPVHRERRSALEVVVLGRVTRSKGQWRVIEALGRMSATDVAVTFVGGVLDGGADVELTRRAATLAPAARVRFVGEQAEPFGHVVAADICVIPSDKEAFGRSTLECLALGRAVVTTRSGAGAELVEDGVSGRLVEPDDIPGLAAALDTYAADRELVRRHGAAARQRADAIVAGPHTLDAVVDLLSGASEAPPADLPPRWRDWLEHLDERARLRAPGAWRIAAAVSRGVHLAGRAVRHPRRAVRAVRTRRGSPLGRPEPHRYDGGMDSRDRPTAE